MCEEFKLLIFLTFYGNATLLFVFSPNKQKSFLCKNSLTPKAATRECGNISDELVLLKPESSSCHSTRANVTRRETFAENGKWEPL